MGTFIKLCQKNTNTFKLRQKKGTLFDATKKYIQISLEKKISENVLIYNIYIIINHN